MTTSAVDRLVAATRAANGVRAPGIDAEGL